MCSWFCETFCCFLLRCRDSCSQDTDNTSPKQSKSSKSNTHNPGNRPENTANTKHLTIPQSTPRRHAIETIQPQPKPTLSTLERMRLDSRRSSKNKPLPPLIPPFNASGFNLSTVRDGSDIVRRDFVASPNRQPVEGDIGLFSPKHVRPVSSPPSHAHHAHPGQLGQQGHHGRQSLQSRHSRTPGIQVTPAEHNTHQKSLPELPPQGALQFPDPTPNLGHIALQYKDQPTASHTKPTLPLADDTALTHASMTDFAAATAMIDIPDEFAPSSWPEGNPVAEDGDAVTKAWQQDT